MWVFLKNLNGASFYWKSLSLNLRVSIVFQVTTIGHPTWPKADRRVMHIIRNNRFHFSVGCLHRGETYRLASKGNENCTISSCILAYLSCSSLVNDWFNKTLLPSIHLECTQLREQWGKIFIWKWIKACNLISLFSTVFNTLCKLGAPRDVDQDSYSPEWEGGHTLELKQEYAGSKVCQMPLNHHNNNKKDLHLVCLNLHVALDQH